MALLAKSNVRNLKGSPSDPLVREVIISQTEQYSVKPPKSIWLPDLKIKTRFENYQRNWVLLISVAFCWFFKRLVKYVLDYRICCYCIFQFQFGNQDVFPMMSSYQISVSPCDQTPVILENRNLARRSTRPNILFTTKKGWSAISGSGMTSCTMWIGLSTSGASSRVTAAGRWLVWHQ